MMEWVMLVNVLWVALLVYIQYLQSRKKKRLEQFEKDLWRECIRLEQIAKLLQATKKATFDPTAQQDVNKHLMN